MSKIILLFIGLFVLQNIQAAEVQARLALIIGNSEYKGEAFLANPVNDAEDLAKVLRDLQFQVSHRQNLTRKEMNAAIEEFGQNLRVTKGMGIFYYAGHGLQVAGENYLLPIGSERALFKASYNLADNTIKASDILKTLETAANAVNVIILDACRDNPFKTRGVPRRPTMPGLKSMKYPGGSLIAFSADHGELALDGKNKRNSPYAASLIRQIKANHNASLVDLFTSVRVDVLDKTGTLQEPGFYSKLNGRYCLMGTCPKPESLVDFGDLLDSVAWWTMVVLAFGVVWLGWRWNLVGTVVTWGRYQAAPMVFTIGAKTWKPFIITSVAWVGWQYSWLNSVGTWGKYLTGLVIEQPLHDTLKIGGYGPEMVLIPAGRFQMGDIQGGGADDEKPVHWVDIDYEFMMGKYEVTVGEYDKFAEATGREKPDDKGWGRGNRPVINVSWDDANAYTKWISQQTGEQYRLPSEAEWEYAARAGTETKYWWGNKIGKNKATCDGCGAKWGWDAKRMTAPVGSFEANPFGLYDTVGNVWEWCADNYQDSYKNSPTDGSAWEKVSKYRVLRGGSWYYDSHYVRAANRYWVVPTGRNLYIGFRVVRML